MTEEKPGLIEKIENIFHRKNNDVDEKLLRASYRAGRKRAELEHGITGVDYHADEEGYFAGDNRKGSIGDGHRKGSIGDGHRKGSIGDSHSKGSIGEGHSGKTSVASSHSRKSSTSNKNREAQVVGASAAAGAVAAEHDTTRGGHTHGQSSNRNSLGAHEIASSSKGAVVTQPPPVNRQPLEQTYGGDFTDGKSPTQLARDGDESGRGDSNSKLIANDNPRYGNEAHPVSGKGEFYDPQDTQGGIYQKGYHGNAGEDHTHTHGKPVGAAAAASATGLAGGVAINHNDSKYPDATEAEVQHRDLKTKPTLYARQEEEEKYLDDILVRAYNAGRQKGRRESESTKSGGSSSGSHSKSADAASEHSKNKSTYNQGGVLAAEEEAAGHSKHPNHSQNAYQTAGKHDSHDSKHTSGVTDGGVSGARGTADTSKSSAAGAAGVAGAAGAAGAYAAHKNHSHEANAQGGTVNAGTSSSDPKFDYDKEMRRLDQSINQTQREIDELNNLQKSHGQISGTSHTSAGSQGHHATTAHSQPHTGTHSALGVGEAKTANSSDVSKDAYYAGSSLGSQPSNSHSGVHSGTPSGTHSGTPSGPPSGTHSGIPSGTYSGTPSGTHSGTHSGIPSGTHSGTPSGTHSGTYSSGSNHTSSGIPGHNTTAAQNQSHTGTGLGVGEAKTANSSDVSKDAYYAGSSLGSQHSSSHSGVHSGTPSGTHSGTPSGTHSGTHSGAYSGTHSGPQSGTHPETTHSRLGGENSATHHSNDGPSVAAVSQGRTVGAQDHTNENISSGQTHSTHTESSANPGLLGGAAGAAAALAGAAASALGYGDKSSSTSEKHLEGQAYDAGYASGSVGSGSTNSHSTGINPTAGNDRGISSTKPTDSGLGTSSGLGSGATTSVSGNHPVTSTGADVDGLSSKSNHTAGLGSATAPSVSGKHPVTSTGADVDGLSSKSNHTAGLGSATAPSVSGKHPVTSTGADVDGLGSKPNHEAVSDSNHRSLSGEDRGNSANATHAHPEATHGHSQAPTGYLDSAKEAIAAAGVAAAGAFGYEGYNHYYKDNNDGAATANHTNTADETKGSSKSVVEGDSASHSPVKTTDKSIGEKPTPSNETRSDTVGEHSSSSESGSKAGGLGSAVAGAVKGAAGAVGLSGKGGAHNHVDSLVEEAANEYEDVSKEPRHKTKSGVLEQPKDSGDSALPTVGGIKLEEESSNKGKEKAIDNTQLENDIASHNKKHGHVNDNRNLIEVAEDNHPEIKKLSQHTADSQDDASARHRTPPN